MDIVTGPKLHFGGHFVRRCQCDNSGVSNCDYIHIERYIDIDPVVILRVLFIVCCSGMLWMFFFLNVLGTCADSSIWGFAGKLPHLWAFRKK